MPRSNEENAVIQEVPRTDMEHIGTIELTRDDQAPRLAREAVTGWVGRSHPARDTLILAASELVTNAVVHADHGHGRHWLLIHLARASDLFRLTVTDPGTALSAPHHVPLQYLAWIGTPSKAAGWPSWPPSHADDGAAISSCRTVATALCGATWTLNPASPTSSCCTWPRCATNPRPR
ncbi:ATP-binding protein [Nonomuraea sp. NPDC049421]|uniref:ATP-binding protein n=1 Tax=Nonomuraea sp. NPDC049421 TaxID=3155275 RepID=UPI003427A725